MTRVSTLAETAMAREIAQAPEALRMAFGEEKALAALVQALRLKQPRLCVVSGRGSSGHVGVFLRYLVETRLGIPVSATAPSITTSFNRSLALSDAVFLVVSQSGRSPDLIESAAAARRAGAITAAIVNDAASPLAETVEFVLPLQSGPELSVAATKTVIASMTVASWLVAAWAEDSALEKALWALPERLSNAQALDWSSFGEALISARAAFVTGRGFGFAPAREIALKMAETLRLPALAYSAAELLHGPRAAITRETPVLALRVADETAMAVDTLVEALKQNAEPVYLAGAAHGDLPWIGSDHPVTDAIALLMPAYACIEATARRMGFDPDHPPHLRKITQTR